MLGDYDQYKNLQLIFEEQQRLINNGTFSGISLTDECDKYFEYALSPTRQKTSEPHVAETGGYISYWAKFLVGMTLEKEREGSAYGATVTLIELAKLPQV